MNHFFLDHSAPTHIDTLSLHDALPISSQSERERWLSLPFTGCDGMPDTGQAWVRSGLLAATVVVPANSGQAIEMLTQSLRSGSQPPERTFTAPLSFPPTEKLAEMLTKKVGAASV